MKRHIASKYRKAKKLEHSKLKAIKEQSRKVKREQHLKHESELLHVDKVPVLDDGKLQEPASGATARQVRIVPDAPPISAARKAFQDT